VRLTVHTFLTLDGVMQSPGEAEEDPTSDFTRGGWLVPYADQKMGDIVEGWFARCEAVLLGRTTYTLMEPYWSQVTDPDNGTATALNQGKKYVVSTTMTDAPWGDSTVIGQDGDVIAAITELKNHPGDGELQIHGSAQLAQTLHRAGLIDEYRLLTFPVTVGSGKRLFEADAPPLGFTVVDSAVTSTGAVYVAAVPQAITTGTFAVVDGKEAV
jgi:dihydrofolate reductase